MTDTTERFAPAPEPPPPAPPGVDGSGRAGSGAPVGGVDHAGWRLAGLAAVLVALGLFNPWMLLVIGAIVLMIFLHELGHYLMAKRAGMKVTEFFLGFGPRLWSTRRGETEYGIKLIPAGAYVKIIGMHSLDEVAPEDEGRTYRQKSFRQRLGVAVAGSTMHFLLALVLTVVVLVGIGAPGGTINPLTQERQWVVGDVMRGSGAADAGLHKGDRIVSINGTRVTTFPAMADIVQPLQGKTVPVVVERHGQRLTLHARLRPFSDDRDLAEAKQARKVHPNAKVTVGRSSCCLGIGADVAPNKRVSPLAAVVAAPRDFLGIARLSLDGLGRFFSPSGISSFASQVASAKKDQAVVQQDRTHHSAATVAQERKAASNGNSRIVSIVGVVQLGSAASPTALLNLFVLVNISIGIINLAPLLPFDGGHVVVAIYEKVQEMRLRRRRYFTDMTRLMPLTYAVVVVLVMLFVTSIYLDIANPLVSR